jgi:hypothetical protein
MDEIDEGLGASLRAQCLSTSELHDDQQQGCAAVLKNIPPKAIVPAPHCHAMTEHPDAILERSRWSSGTHSGLSTPLFIHMFEHGLAYTTGSALGSTPPSPDACLSAFLIPNKAGLTAGARAWSKHSHRSQGDSTAGGEGSFLTMVNTSKGWWGTPSGPIAVINEKALLLFHKVMNGSTWRNLHWLPHQVLVYEVRVPEGYGMRWSQDQKADDGGNTVDRPWIFRGFVEPMMENGHEIGWRH